MKSFFEAPHGALFLALLVPAIYFAGVALGRVLKRHAGVHLGLMYQLFCVVIAIYVPLRLRGLNYVFPPEKPWFDFTRELGALAILLGALFVIALVRRYVWEVYFSQKRGLEIPKFVRDVVALIIFMLAVLLVVSVAYGQRITGVLLTSTVVVGILGLAMQDLIANIMSGVSIHVGKPFKMGDWLLVDETYAEVMEVNWRSTRLRTNDETYLDIPNGQIVKNKIHNLTYPTPRHAIRLHIGIDYSAPPNVVKDVLVRAAHEAKGVMDTPRPKAFLLRFDDSKITYEIKFFIENHAHFNDITDAVRTNVWYALRRARIKMPFPIRTLQIEPRRPVRAQDTDEAMADTRQLVRKQPFFDCLNDAQIAQVAAAANPCCFGRDEEIIEQGTEGESMFIMVEGSAGVYVDRGGTAALVATLMAGDCFGEMSLLTGEKRSATVVAFCDCQVLEIEKKVMSDLLQQNPALMKKLSEVLAQRRIENESVLASALEKQALSNKKEEYTATFLARLYSFFEL